MKRILAILSIAIAILLTGSVLAEPANSPQTFTKVTKVSWLAPIANTDGSVLTDLAGYKIYCGKSPGAYSDQNSIYIKDPGITMILLADIQCLIDGDNYFALTAVNSAGLESEYSSDGYAKKLAGGFYKDPAAVEITIPKGVTNLLVD